MSDRSTDGGRSGRWAALFVLLPAAWVIAVTLIPKDAAFAAPSRFVLTALTFLIMLGGLFGAVVNQRRYRAHLLLRRFRGATRAMQDTLQFILHERRLSTRGRLPLLMGAASGLALSVLSTWPQCAAIAGLHPTFKVVAGSCALLLVLQPFYVRSHIVNAIYLRRYLRQQADHIGFRPGRRDRAGMAARQNLTIKDGVFQIGGFDWKNDDLYKNVLVLGAPGSGKTACVLNSFLSRLMESSVDGLHGSGLIIDPKGAYKDKIGPLCESIGRAADLYVLSADEWADRAGTRSAISWNPVDTLDPAVEVAARLITSMKLAGGVETRDSFFLDAARHFLRHSLTLYRAARAPDVPSLLDLQNLCSEPTDEPVEYRRLVAALTEKYPHDVDPEIDAAIRYMETEWRPLPEKQRAGVKSTVNQLIDDFTSQPFAEMLSGRSTIKIAEIIDRGGILYMHQPLAGRERLAKILTNLVKLEFQREILRRVGKPRPSFLLADEYQTVFTSGEEHSDTNFFEASRESRHANVVAAQNLSSFFKKTPNRSDVTNFFGLFAVKIFLRNTERETLD